MIGIYKIESPTNRVYIGQSLDINQRKKSYISNSNINQRKIYNSINKYGFDKHTFTIVELCSEEELNNRERYWQEYYDSVRNGLNCRYQSTDDKSGRLSEETKQKLREKDFSYLIGNNFREGIPHTDDIKEKISNSLKGRMAGAKNPMYGMSGDKNPFYGKTHTEETKRKLAISSASKTHIVEELKKYNENRKVLLLDTETGVFYESISEASKLMGIKYPTLKAMLSGRNRNKTNLIKV